jgi:hypothetical protein
MSLFVVTRSAHWGLWSVQEKVVNNATGAQKGQLVTTQEPRQPVAGQFRNEARTN